ncbi:YciI family protein [Hydrogenophaga sp.]|uniref:YciI family protein n=1 Tax=Hydrogenophaga sp. TaxID=1904254 RepID=UPI003D0C17FE
MKYLGLAYYNPEKFAAMAPDDVQALVSQCPAMDDRMRATGKVLVAASLAETRDWVALRPRGGKPQISDGPYTEAKEVVGGLFIIEANDREEAIRLAAMHPAASIGEAGGWGVELIPMESFFG